MKESTLWIEYHFQWLGINLRSIRPSCGRAIHVIINPVPVHLQLDRTEATASITYYVLLLLVLPRQLAHQLHRGSAHGHGPRDTCMHRMTGSAPGRRFLKSKQIKRSIDAMHHIRVSVDPRAASRLLVHEGDQFKRASNAAGRSSI